ARHSAANRSDGLYEILLNFGIASAKRSLLALDEPFQVRMRLEKRQRHRSRLVQIEIDANAEPARPGHQRRKIFQSFIEMRAEMEIPWKWRQFREHALEPD